MSETEIPQRVLQETQERATRGAEFLDERRPGWVAKIDRKRLDMLSSRDCILGQLYGDYEDGLHALRPLSRTDLGFSVTSMESRGVYFPALRKAWLKLIEERLAVPA